MAIQMTRLQDTATTTAAKVLGASSTRRALQIYAVDGDLYASLLDAGAVAGDTTADDVKIAQGKVWTFSENTVPSNEVWIRSSTGNVKYVVYYSEG